MAKAILTSNPDVFFVGITAGGAIPVGSAVVSSPGVGDGVATFTPFRLVTANGEKALVLASKYVYLSSLFFGWVSRIAQSDPSHLVRAISVSLKSLEESHEFSTLNFIMASFMFFGVA